MSARDSLLPTAAADELDGVVSEMRALGPQILELARRAEPFHRLRGNPATESDDEIDEFARLSETLGHLLGDGYADTIADEGMASVCDELGTLRDDLATGNHLPVEQEIPPLPAWVNFEAITTPDEIAQRQALAARAQAFLPALIEWARDSITLAAWPELGIDEGRTRDAILERAGIAELEEIEELLHEVPGILEANPKTAARLLAELEHEHAGLLSGE